jgi:hypothetical protein
METLKCKVCQKDKNIEEFRRLTGLFNKFNKLCRECIAPHKARYDTKSTSKNTRTPAKKYVKKKPVPQNGFRICTKCHDEKPATLEFFHKQEKGKDGLSARCGECANRTKREWCQANPDKVKASSQREIAHYTPLIAFVTACLPHRPPKQLCE